MKRTTYLVHPAIHEVCKFLPHNPPMKGEVVLVDGERRRVTKTRIDWEGRQWTLRELHVVEP